MDKYKILKEICDWFGYKYKIDTEGCVIDNGISDYSLKIIGVKSSCGHFEYENVDEALKGWLSTIKEDQKENGIDWKEEIRYINSL